MILAVTAAVMAAAAGLVWPLFCRWAAHQVPGRPIREAGRLAARHPRLAARISRRLDPDALTGLALTTAAVIIATGAVVFGLVLAMVRNHFGFAQWDVSGARFAAKHATATSTAILRVFTQLGGALVMVPLALVVWAATARRRGAGRTFAYLVTVVGGQFALADTVKWIVDRTRPDVDRLTGFSGPSFPSGHATASAACLAAFALLLGAGRSPKVQASLAAAAVGLAAGISCSRVFLGVHWITDVLGGLALGWTWFAITTLAFGGRLLRFAAPAAAFEGELQVEARVGDASAEGDESARVGQHGAHQRFHLSGRPTTHESEAGSL